MRQSSGRRVVERGAGTAPKLSTRVGIPSGDIGGSEIEESEGDSTVRTQCRTVSPVASRSSLL